jgi:tRNA threonylcarbamoyladenosine biosynthesis protein TsaB
LNILFIDSATEACSAALWCDGEIVSDFEMTPRGHAQRLLPMAEQLMAKAGIRYPELDLIGFGRGPGSFTGVRIATACAQGIALGLDVPMVGVSSLATLAQGQMSRLIELGVIGPIHAAIDARMGEVYYAAFVSGDGGLVISAGPEQVIAPEVLLQQSDWSGGLATGSGFGRYPALTQRGDWAAIVPEALPHAQDAILLAVAVPRTEWIDPADAAPIYLRDNVATVRG